MLVNNVFMKQSLYRYRDKDRRKFDRKFDREVWRHERWERF